MGSNQSRPSDAAIQEKLLERLQALQLKDERSMNEKDGYVYVDNGARMSNSLQGSEGIFLRTYFLYRTKLVAYSRAQARRVCCSYQRVGERAA